MHFKTRCAQEPAGTNARKSLPHSLFFDCPVMSDLAISMKGAGALPTTKSSESVINTPPGPAMLGVGTEKPAQSARTWRQFIGCALTIAGALTMVFGGASIAGAVVGGILLCIGLTITGFEVITGDDSEGLNENQPQPTVVDTNEL